MTNVVVDSSVVVKWFVAELYSTEALRIPNDYNNGLLSFLAPDIINAEVANIFWKKILFQGLSVASAEIFMQDFEKLHFTFTPSKDLMNDAFQLAVNNKRAVYDSLYLALSQRENCQFVTADEKLVNAVSSSMPDSVWLANW